MEHNILATSMDVLYFFVWKMLPDLNAKIYLRTTPIENEHET